MAGTRLTNIYHPFWRSLAYWVFVTAAMLAVFFIARKLTLCWTLTALAGIPPPAECAIQNQPPSNLPASPDPTISIVLAAGKSSPQMELSKWDAQYY